jgi:hypothetical protein
MKCRKCCGPTTRRSAGIFSCRHCGVQPGQAIMDRGGIPAPIIEYPSVAPTEADLLMRPRQDKLRGSSPDQRPEWQAIAAKRNADIAAIAGDNPHAEINIDRQRREPTAERAKP